MAKRRKTEHLSANAPMRGTASNGAIDGWRRTSYKDKRRARHAVESRKMFKALVRGVRQAEKNALRKWHSEFE